MDIANNYITTKTFNPTDAIYKLSEDETGDGLSETQVNNLIDEKQNALIGGAPEALNTLKEISDSINANDNFIGYVNTQLGTKPNKNGEIAYTGNHEFMGGEIYCKDQSYNPLSYQVANLRYVESQVDGKASKTTSNVFTGIENNFTGSEVYVKDQTQGEQSFKVANLRYVNTAVSTKANIDTNNTFTGTTNIFNNKVEIKDELKIDDTTLLSVNQSGTSAQGNQNDTFESLLINRDSTLKGSFHSNILNIKGEIQLNGATYASSVLLCEQTLPNWASGWIPVDSGRTNGNKSVTISLGNEYIRIPFRYSLYFCKSIITSVNNSTPQAYATTTQPYKFNILPKYENSMYVPHNTNFITRIGYTGQIIDSLTPNNGSSNSSNSSTFISDITAQGRSGSGNSGYTLQIFNSNTIKLLFNTFLCQTPNANADGFEFHANGFIQLFVWR
jgi:hypothetical protein